MPSRKVRHEENAPWKWENFSYGRRVERMRNGMRLESDMLPEKMMLTDKLLNISRAHTYLVIYATFKNINILLQHNSTPNKIIISNHLSVSSELVFFHFFFLSPVLPCFFVFRYLFLLL